MKHILLIGLFLIIVNCQKPIIKSCQIIVNKKFTGKSGSLVNGVPTFRTIGKALSSIPKDNDKPLVIFSLNGNYHEKLVIDFSNVHFIGEHCDSTIITFNATGDTSSPNGTPYGHGDVQQLKLKHPDFMLRILL